MKPFLAILIALAVLFTACSSPIAERGDTVSLTYTGRHVNGTIFDSNDPANMELLGRTSVSPLVVRVGSGQVIPGFEDALFGMKQGQSKTVTIKARDAYGTYDPQKTLIIPKQSSVSLVTVSPRLIEIPSKDLPPALQSLGGLGKNYSTENFVYNITRTGFYSNGTGFAVVRLLEARKPTFQLEGTYWPSVLESMNETHFTIRSIIDEEKTYYTKFGPYTVDLNETHATLHTTLKLGDIVPTNAGQSVASSETMNSITLDFNHPLAGRDLIFDIKVDELVKKV